jgi:histone acetyltransferase (RNA polymerase elongator complex component)
MPLKHYTIPIFIPELACPNQCVFCNQRKISGQLEIPSQKEVREKIELHLKTIPKENNIIEVGFFGGNFTGIELDLQKQYLEITDEYFLAKKIDAIRISTRPDYINSEILEFLKIHHVSTIELGAQSMNDEVLIQSERGHTAGDIEKASKEILSAGFRLGLQMMIGLPCDTFEKSMQTARKIISLKANETRIYPTLVIAETKLEKLYQQGIYKPLSLDEAVFLSKELFKEFENHEVKIIRMGLHPSEELVNNTGFIAGPFHQSFKELVLTELWKEKLDNIENKEGNKNVVIYVPISQINYAVGHNGKNKSSLLHKFKNVVFKTDAKLTKREYYIEYN